MAQSNFTPGISRKAKIVGSGNAALALAEEQITDALSKIPIVKKIYCRKEGLTLKLVVMHTSPSIARAIDVIIDQVVSVEDRMSDLDIDSRVLHESKIDFADISHDKILFERR